MPQKKDRKIQSNLFLKPEKYIIEKAGALPLGLCFINEDWKENSMANIFICRQHPAGSITLGIYYIDLLCCGLRDTYYLFSLPPFEFEELIKIASEDLTLIQCSYELAHNIIFGSIDFADVLGLKPHKDWKITQHILKDDSEDIEFIDIHFGGKNGRPMLIETPDSPTAEIRRTLDKSIGPKGYDIVQSVDPFEDLEEDDEDDDDDDEMDMTYKTEEIINLFWKLYDSPLKQMDKLDKEAQIRISELPITYEVLTEEANGLSKEEIKMMPEIYDLVHSHPEKAIRKLKSLIATNPQNPVFHNHLMNTYFMTGQVGLAKQALAEQYRMFPDYLIARINYAHKMIAEDRLAEIPKIFNGGLYDLRLLYPARKEFHFTEIESFYTLIARYYINQRRFLNAEHLIHQLMEIPLGEDTKQLTNVIHELNRKKLSLIFGDNFPDDDFTTLTWKPTLRHSLINTLNDYDLEISDAILSEILSLPREEYLADLKQAVFAAVLKIVNEKIMPNGEDMPEVISHAWFLIGECGDPEQLDYLLAILGIDSPILQSSFGDMLTEKAWMPLYRLGMDRLDTLSVFLADNFAPLSKSIVSQAMLQIALQEPTRTDSVKEIYHKLLAGMLEIEDPEDDEQEFMNDLANDIADLKDPSFLPLLKELDKRELIDESFATFEELSDAILNPLNIPYKPPVQNIFEIYKDVRENW